MDKQAWIPVVLVICSSFPVRGSCQVPNCANPQNTQEQIICAQSDFETAEHDMQAAYKAALQRYGLDDAERQDELRMDKVDRAEAVRYRTTMIHGLDLSQRAWASYRKAACKTVLDNYEFGTAGPIAEISCRAELTRERTSFLRSSFLQE